MQKERLVGQKWLESQQKRFMGLSLSVSTAPVSGPLLIASAAMISMVDEHSPFFAQTRCGKGQAPFTIYKLRSMPLGSEESVNEGHYDSRATAIGNFMRISRIDELPQLGNVLKGEMSIVGFRPLIKQHVTRVLDDLSPTNQKRWLDARNRGRPGMFDYYSLRRYMDDAADDSLTRAEMDIEYSRTATFTGDLAIIAEATGFYKKIVEDRLQIG